jgi:hypothetical protein
MESGRPVVSMRCEFDVPDEGFATLADEDRRLEVLRRALISDERWNGSRVAAIRKADPNEGWHLDVWTIPLSGANDDLARTCEGVYETVSSVVPGATLLACRAKRG